MKARHDATLADAMAFNEKLRIEVEVGKDAVSRSFSKLVAFFTGGNVFEGTQQEGDLLVHLLLEIGSRNPAIYDMLDRIRVKCPIKNCECFSHRRSNQ